MFVLLKMNYKQQFGLSFIEVLVAVVVIAIGLIGIVGLQGAAVGNTAISSMRSTAAIESGNLVARMRANLAFWGKPVPGSGLVVELATTGMTVTKHADTSDAFTDFGAAIPAAGSDPKDCAANGCSAAEMAVYDFHEWSEGLRDTLHPDATASLTYSSSPDIIRLVVTWSEKQSAFMGGSDNPKSYSVSINL